MKIVVADPSALLRDTMAAAFDTAPDIQVVGAADSLSALLRACRSTAPQVVVAAPRFADGSLHEHVGELLMGDTRVLAISDATTDASITQLLFAGASGCLSWRDAAPSDLVGATRDVAAGRAALHPMAAAAVLAQWRGVRGAGSATHPPTAAIGTSPLTAREADVLAALARGLPTKTIGRELAISPKTVESHVGRLLAKLGARSRAQAVSIAHDRGLLDVVETGEPRCGPNGRPAP
jgi:DNA-binding NarL/FixJ family response regulator